MSESIFVPDYLIGPCTLEYAIQICGVDQFASQPTLTVPGATLPG